MFCQVATEHPAALTVVRSLMVQRPAHNTEVDDVEFDVEDEINLRSMLHEAAVLLKD